MTKQRIANLTVNVMSNLDEAFASATVAEARCCLEQALDSTRQLAEGDALTEDVQLAVNETCTALAARGW
jgi:hypothetical protein